MSVDEITEFVLIKIVLPVIIFGCIACFVYIALWLIPEQMLAQRECNRKGGVYVKQAAGYACLHVEGVRLLPK